MAGTLTVSTISDETNSTSATNIIRGSLKAWMNYKGNSPYSVRASFNVSSVTYNGSGDYSMNFTTALTDVNYCASGITGPKGVNSEALTLFSYVSASVVRIQSSAGNSTSSDAPNINCNVVR
jgi:hypothetical protein